MRAYIIRRLIAVPLMLLAMSFFLFILLFIRPGNAALAVSGGFNEAGARSEEFERSLGLDRPWYIQYLDWLGDAVRGDLGQALKPPRHSVTGQIKDRIGNTAEIGLLTIALSAIIGLTVGVLSAAKRNSSVDYILRLVTIVGISVPSFWTATLLVTLPAKYWQVTPGLASNYYTLWDNPIENLKIVIWPAMILSVSSAAYIARIVRSSMLETLYSDHVRTARMKGLAERVVILRHVLRTSLIAVVTVLGLQLGTVLGGAVIAEQIFAIPGMGLLTYEAVFAEDYTLVLGTMMVFAAMFLLITLLVDISYTFIDPRIRY
ncbi:MAG: ABC transporter permease [Dehalococcoidia bacterium]